MSRRLIVAPLCACLLAVLRASAQAPVPPEPPPPEDTPAQRADEPAPAADPPAAGDTEATEAEPAAPVGQPVSGWLEAQVQLSREGFSCGSIDGVRGLQT